ncbi:hypothetical protein SDC9_91204 [bioreactor metagenome]|uniref:Uncharacterized protein n=1 Tax=bioreactor metagenome TaxID=1076179 RepID=A0A644ZUY6_9ZZZZ
MGCEFCQIDGFLHSGVSAADDNNLSTLIHGTVTSCAIMNASSLEFIRILSGQSSRRGTGSDNHRLGIIFRILSVDVFRLIG